MNRELKHCQHCGKETAKRIRCNICHRLFCRVCIGMGTTARDLAGPLCEKCTKAEGE
jgi:late competence protein required for DNA uptake (superfamily II DNA/RNA helicase)